jgi:hypothetical protein
MLTAFGEAFRAADHEQILSVESHRPRTLITSDVG